APVDILLIRGIANRAGLQRMPREQLGSVVRVVELAVQTGMDAGQMVALEKIVDIRLPVALHHVLAPLVEAHLLEAKLRRLRRQLPQRADQICRSAAEVHEYQATPLLGANRLQAKVFKAEIFHALTLRRVQQLALE